MATPPPPHETTADLVLSRLHTTARSSTPHPILPHSTLRSTATLLHNPTTPASTISAVLTALSQLPPPSLPPNQAHLLAPAISAAALRARSVLTPLDLRHAARLIAQLAARSDASARAVVHSGSVGDLFRACSAVVGRDVVLREGLRRVAMVTGMRREEYLRGIGRGGGGGKRGVRILAIDGGGTRAVLAVEILKRIEEEMGVPLGRVFDLIGGTSSGGVVGLGVGLLGMKLGEVEEVYMTFAKTVFRGVDRGRGGGIYRAGKVLLNRGVYDGRVLNKLYERHCGPDRLYEHAGGGGVPRVFVLSTQIGSKEQGVRTPRPFLHANYRGEGGSRYAHGCWHKLSEALSATTAAPVYFEAFVDEGGEAFCDGGVVMNNPASVAVHEARWLWPKRPLGVVVSVGTGRFSADEGEVRGRGGGTGLEGELGGRVGMDEKGRAKMGQEGKQTVRRGSMAFRVAQAVLESATDTESVHHTLEDLLGRDDAYFRLNPSVRGEEVGLDEYRPEVLTRLRDAGREYVTKGPGAEMVRKLCHKLKQHSREGSNGYGMWLTKAGRSYARL